MKSVQPARISAVLDFLDDRPREWCSKRQIMQGLEHENLRMRTRELLALLRVGFRAKLVLKKVVDNVHLYRIHPGVSRLTIGKPHCVCSRGHM
jgi:hypothetical protein